MHRATTFEAGNPSSIAHTTAFATMAKAADRCLTTVSGISLAGPQVVRQDNTSLLTQMIAALEARLADPATAG